MDLPLGRRLNRRNEADGREFEVRVLYTMYSDDAGAGAGDDDDDIIIIIDDDDDDDDDDDYDDDSLRLGAQ